MTTDATISGEWLIVQLERERDEARAWARRLYSKAADLEVMLALTDETLDCVITSLTLAKEALSSVYHTDDIAVIRARIQEAWAKMEDGEG